MEYVLPILSVDTLTPTIKRFHVKKPENFTFVPGHSAILSVNKDNVRAEFKPFTFTSTNADPYLEFIIKSYEHSPITQAFHNLEVGDEILMHAVFGSIRYQGTGLFIAGGTGITPFLAIFRQLKQDKALEGNTLIYVAKTHQDLLYEEELKSMLKHNCHIMLTQEKLQGYQYGRPTFVTLKDHTVNLLHSYVCGPPAFTNDMKILLKQGQLLSA